MTDWDSQRTVSLPQSSNKEGRETKQLLDLIHESDSMMAPLTLGGQIGVNGSAWLWLGDEKCRVKQQSEYEQITLSISDRVGA